MGAVRYRGACIMGNKKGVAVDGGTHPQPTERSQPNQALEPTANSVRCAPAVGGGSPRAFGF
jgi:hypothetical protein